MRLICGRAWIAAVVSAALQMFIFPIAGPLPFWRSVFSWIALVPLLFALITPTRNGSDLTIRQSFYVGYFCGFLWYFGNCYWIYQTMYLYGGLPKLVALGILVLFALYLGVYHGLFALLFGSLRRSSIGLDKTLLLVPFLWVAVELARARITGFPWDLLGYSQVDNFLLTRMAPIAGVMMLSFVIAAINGVITLGFISKSRPALWLLRAGFVVAAILQLAGTRQPARDAATHVATLLQENLAVGAQGREVETLRSAEKYQRFRALSLAPQTPSPAVNSPAAKPELLIWPEAPADFATSDPVFIAQLGSLAHDANAETIAGSLGVDFNTAFEGGYHEFGSAAIFDEHGSYTGRYDKIHRVPWGEYVPYKELFFFAGNLVGGVGRMSPGHDYTVFNANAHRFGVFICYESIFGDEVRKFTQRGANVLINISDDGWYGDTGAPWQHLNMARMRAMENRRWILRDTNTGVTTAIDPHGRGVFTTPRHIRAAFAFPFDYRDDLTLYVRFGDWFAWLCALVSLAALIVALVQSTKKAPQPHRPTR